MTVYELKTCPHCGERGLLRVLDYGDGTLAAYVHCVGCKAQTALHLTGERLPSVPGPYCRTIDRRATLEDAKRAAIQDWEARA